LDQMTHVGRAAAEAPHANPAEVFERIAEVDELPVEDGRDAAAALEEVTRTIIAVDDSDLRRDRPMALQPGERPFEHRAWTRRPTREKCLRESDLQRRRAAFVDAGSERLERRATPFETVESGERRHELFGERLAERWGKRLATLGDPRKRRLAFDLLAN